MDTTKKSTVAETPNNAWLHFQPGRFLCSPLPEVMRSPCREKVDHIVEENLLPLNLAVGLYGKSQFSKFVSDVSAVLNKNFTLSARPIKRLLNIWDVPEYEKSFMAEYGLPNDEAQFEKDVAMLASQHKERIASGYLDMFWSYFFAADGDAAYRFAKDPMGASRRFLEIVNGDADEGRKNIILNQISLAARASGRNDLTVATVELLMTGLRSYTRYAGQTTMDSAHYFHDFAERGFRTTSALFHTLYPQLFFDDKSNRAFFPQKIRRVLIIGPGLEFSNDELGTKVPRQMYEPFAIIDGLVKNSYAELNTLSVDLVDINPEVIAHARAAVDAAKNGYPYKLALSIGRTDQRYGDLKAFFDRFGMSLPGASREAVQQTANGALWQTLSIPPDIVRKMHPIEADVTTQTFSPAGEYDLILCFNTMVYFNNKERFLAGINISRALNFNGTFLTDNLFVKDTGVRLDNPGGPNTKVEGLFRKEFPLKAAGIKIPVASDNTMNPMIVYRNTPLVENLQTSL